MKTDQRVTAMARFVAGTAAAAITVLFLTSIFSCQPTETKDPSPTQKVAVIANEQQKRATEEPDAREQPDGTRRMAQLLEQLGKDSDRKLLEQRPDANLARYVRNIKPPLDLRSRTILEAKEAYDLLLLGQSQEAAQRFQRIKDTIVENKSLFDANLLRVVREYLAISYLRRGEQANCICQHSPDSCLFPIKGSGVHRVKQGSQAAIKEYAEVLNENPKDLTARWLLNIAYMTLGEYPDNVPKRWLIAPDLFKSEHEFQRFSDVAPQWGVDAVGLAGGCIIEDFDGDGYLDLMTSSSGLEKGRDQLRFFHNNGDGTFSDRTAEAGLSGIIGGKNLIQADYNNDGFPDVLVLRGGGLLGRLGQQPLSLLRNNGDGTFEDVTEKAGLLAFHPTQAAAWADYDNDGWLDLFVGVESSPVPYFDVPLYRDFERPKEQRCRLYHNNRNGTFTECAREVGLDVVGYVKGVAWGDYDNDGLPDLFLSRMYGPGLLFRNEGRNRAGQWEFKKVAAMEPAQSSVAWFWDYNNDGWLDLFVSGYSSTGGSYAAGQVAAGYLGLPFTAELPRLYRNERGRSFTDVTRAVGLNKVLYAVGGNFGDLDNDGWPDIYLSTGGADYRALIPNRMFRNAEGKGFQDVTSAAAVGHLQKGGAVAFGDINNDGTPDIYTVLGGDVPGDAFRRALFLNPGCGNHWITLRLEGVQSNRSAIGARIKVSVDSENTIRDIYATVSSGGSYGASTLQQTIGLGKATSIRSIEIRWPTTGKVQIFEQVKMDQMVRIREGEARPIPLKLKAFGVSADGKHVHN
jgi:hypothetical protein